MIIKKNLSVILWSMIVFVFIGILLFTLYIIALDGASYINISIPSPSSYLPRGDWLYTEKTKRIYEDSRNTFYIWRRETSVSLNSIDPKSPFLTWESIFEYFDKYLSDFGWELDQNPAYDICEEFLPDYEYFPKGKYGYTTFTRPDEIDLSAKPVICLGILPTNDGTNSTTSRYRIIFATINPSKTTKWRLNYID